jgi:hypothetical protein
MSEQSIWFYRWYEKAKMVIYGDDLKETQEQKLVG